MQLAVTFLYVMNRNWRVANTILILMANLPSMLSKFIVIWKMARPACIQRVPNTHRIDGQRKLVLTNGS